jgi:hypothetical protein
MKSLLIFSILIISVFSNLFAERWTSEMLLSKIKIDLLNIQKDSTIQYLHLPEYTYKKDNTPTISFKDFSPELFVINGSELDTDISAVNVLQYKGHEGKTVALKYSLKFTVDDSAEQSGEVVFTDKMFYLYNVYVLDNGVTQIKSKLGLQLKVGSATISGDAPLNVIIDALNEYITNQKDLIETALNSDVTIYYTKQNKKVANESVVTFTGYDPKYEYTLDITPVTVPFQATKTSVIIYRRGFINDFKGVDESAIFPESKNSQLYISKQLLKYFIGKAAASYDFSLTQERLNPYSNIELTIQYLGQLVPSMFDLYARTSQFKIQNQITNVAIDDSIKDKISGLIKIHSDFVQLSDKKYKNKIFDFDATVKFSLKDKLDGMKLNFYIDSLEIVDLDSQSNNFIVYEKLLSWMNKLYKSYFVSNKQYFFETDLNLTQIFPGTYTLRSYYSEFGYIIETTGQVSSLSELEDVKEVKAVEKKALYIHNDLFPNFLNK